MSEKCGVLSHDGELVQYQLRPDEGWTTSAEGSFTCNGWSDHPMPHIQSGEGLVSWPWGDLGNGAGVWKDSGEAFPALWVTDAPPIPVEDVVRR